MKEIENENTIKHPYQKPIISKIPIDRQISLLMQTAGDPPLPPVAPPEEPEPDPIWG